MAAAVRISANDGPSARRGKPSSCPCYILAASQPSDAQPFFLCGPLASAVVDNAEAAIVPNTSKRFICFNWLYLVRRGGLGLYRYFFSIFWRELSSITAGLNRSGLNVYLPKKEAPKLRTQGRSAPRDTTPSAAA